MYKLECFQGDMYQILKKVNADHSIRVYLGSLPECREYIKLREEETQDEKE